MKRILLCSISIFALNALAADWPEFRGPGAQGHAGNDALRDDHASVREHAVRLCEGGNEALARQCLTDKSPRVLRQLAFTLGQGKGKLVIEGLVYLAVQHPKNTDIQLAVKSSAAPHAAAALARLYDNAPRAAAERDEEKFSQWDKVFHLAIAEGTRNPLMITMYGQINHVRTHDRWESIKGAILTPPRIRQYNNHHRDVFDAIRRRDPESAIACMNTHLHLAQQDLLVPPGASEARPNSK